MSKEQGSCIKKHFAYGVFVVLSAFFVFTSWRSIKFDPDGMHEGFHLLLAVSASEGQLPPEIFTRYGIIQPLIEGLWLSFTKNDLVALRTLTFLIILTMFIGILIIGKRLITGKLYWVPALMWLAINPINDFFNPLTQSTWPNLLGQFLVVWILVLMLRLESSQFTGDSNFIFLGLLIGALPFIRFQFCLQVFIFLALILHGFGKRKALMSLGACFSTVGFWAIIFEENDQSLSKYINQVTFVGISERERLGQLKNVIDNFLDFTVALIMPSLFFLLIIVVSDLIRKRELNKTRKYLFISLTILMIIIIVALSSRGWWLSVLPRIQYWFCGGAIIVSSMFLLKIRTKAKSLRGISSQEITVRKISALETRYSIYLLVLFCGTLVPPLMANSGYLRLISHLLLVPALVILNSGKNGLATNILKKFLALLLSISLILDIAGAIRYQIEDRIPLDNGYAYSGMSAALSKVEENQMESTIVGEMVKNVNIRKSEVVEVYFHCSNGIYHLNDNIIYGDASNWYRLDMREGTFDFVRDEISSLPKGNLVIGCMYSEKQIQVLKETKLVAFDLLKYSNYSKTYSFVAQKT